MAREFTAQERKINLSMKHMLVTLALSAIRGNVISAHCLDSFQRLVIAYPLGTQNKVDEETAIGAILGWLEDEMSQTEILNNMRQYIAMCCAIIADITDMPMQDEGKLQ